MVKNKYNLIVDEMTWSDVNPGMPIVDRRVMVIDSIRECNRWWASSRDKGGEYCCEWFFRPIENEMIQKVNLRRKSFYQQKEEGMEARQLMDLVAEHPHVHCRTIG